MNKALTSNYIVVWKTPIRPKCLPPSYTHFLQCSSISEVQKFANTCLSGVYDDDFGKFDDNFYVYRYFDCDMPNASGYRMLRASFRSGVISYNIYE